MKKKTNSKDIILGIMLTSTAVLLTSCCTAVELKESESKTPESEVISTTVNNTASNTVNNNEITQLTNTEIADIDNAIKICTLSAESAKTTTKQKTKYEEKEVPACDTWFKSYMSYKAITNTRSDQYKIQQSAWTDENGLRRYGDDYLIAMGTYYTDKCYTRFLVEFDTGETITVMTGDIKQDRHTDGKNQYNAVYDETGKFVSANVLEFIVDMSVLDTKARRLGSVHCIEPLGGNIVSIKRIVDEAKA